MATRQVILHPADEGGYWVDVPSLPGCFSQGDTKEEALANIREAIALHLEEMIAAGEDIPDDPAPLSVETVAV
jgi:predicted RNase H-like HicB family nuclease